MEKRLFFAIFLSLAILFVFQSFLVPQRTGTTTNSQVFDNKELAGSKSKEKDSTVLSPAPTTANDLVESFSEEKRVLKAGGLEAEFTNKGGNLDRLFLPSFNYSLPVSGYLGVDEFNNKPFAYSFSSKDKIELRYQGQDWAVTKKFSFDKPWQINATVSFKNVSSAPKAFQNNIQPLHLDLSRLDNGTIKSDWTLFEYSIKLNNKIIRKGNAANFTDKWNKEESGNVRWVAFRDRYFATVVDAEAGLNGYSVKARGEKGLLISANSPSAIVNPSEEISFKFTIFAGPQKMDVLKAAGKEFSEVMVFSNWGWLDAIAKGIYWLLGALHKIIPVWGLCIILISLIVYGAMYPLTFKSMMSMKRMQALQPKIAELREKHKKNPEKLNQEIIELYKVNQVNPVSGCLPLILQMPIFVGLYQVLWRSIYFRGEGFLWIKDLSMPDHLFKLPVNVPFLGEYFNIFPIIMTVIMFAQQKMTMKSMAGGDPDQVAQQKIMAVFFPIFLGFIFYNFASGLNLYFVVFYLLSTLSQWHISRSMPVGAK